MWPRRARFLAVLALVMMQSAPGNAEEEAAEKSLLDQAADYVQLREGTDGKNELLSRPAQFVFVAPSKGDSTIAADLAAVGTFSIPLKAADSEIQLGPTIEYHRNTAPKKEQDSLRTGGALSAIIGDIAEDGVLPAHSLQLSPTYLRDNEKDEESFLATFDYIPIANLRYFPVGRIRGIAGSDPKTETWDWRYLRVRWLPVVGFDFQDVLRTNTPKDPTVAKAPTGSELRLYASLSIGLYPFAEALDSQLELQVSRDQWFGVYETNGVHPGDDTRGLFQTSLTYFLDSEQRIGVAVSYVDGQNPRQGKPDQTYWQLSLKGRL